MLQEFRSFLTDEKGEVVSWAAFKSKVADKGELYNVHYLETEYNSAIASAQMAEKWEGLQSFPALEYRTVGDDRVRPEHAALDGLILRTDDPLWNSIYPPNDWNCRCSVVPAATTDVPASEDDALKRYKAAKIKPYFRKNVGTDKVIFRDGHPYFKQAPKELDALRNYNLPEVGKIMDMEDLPMSAYLPDQEAAQHWWKQVSGQKGYLDVRTSDGISIRLDSHFERHVVNREKGNRYRYASSVLEMLQNPDEVWSHHHKGELQNVYIKYYADYPYAVAVKNHKGTMRFETFYQYEKGGKLNMVAIRNQRKGVLKQRSR